jgi:glycosyltransferase involved in cell wall biosynthesis
MTAQQTLFSIIIPTYSRPAELANCLEALARQRLAADSFEVVVVDDGSPVPPNAVVRRFSDRLDISLLVANHGGPAVWRATKAPSAPWAGSLPSRTMTADPRQIGSSRLRHAVRLCRITSSADAR